MSIDSGNSENPGNTTIGKFVKRCNFFKFMKTLLLTSKLAHQYGIKIAPHMFPELSIHIVASIKNPSWLEYMGWYDHLWEEPLLPINGALQPTDRPGHGMDFKPEIVTF